MRKQPVLLNGQRVYLLCPELSDGIVNHRDLFGPQVEELGYRLISWVPTTVDKGYAEITGEKL